MEFDRFETVEMLIRTTAVFVVLLILAACLAKRKRGSLSIFDYLAGIMIGAMAAHIALDTSISAIAGVVSLVWFSVLTILVTYMFTTRRN